MIMLCLKFSNLYTYSFSVMTTQTTEKQDGLRALEGAIEEVTSKITSFGGTLTVKMAPKVISHPFPHVSLFSFSHFLPSPSLCRGNTC